MESFPKSQNLINGAYELSTQLPDELLDRAAAGEFGETLQVLTQSEKARRDLAKAAS